MLALAVVALLAAGATPPAPTHHVEDHASFLSAPTRDTLDARLADYERATGHQVVVWIDHTLGSAALDEWSVKTFAAWKLGRKGQDDGIAMFIFADDHAIDIEVGYGLEEKVPDVIAARIIREVMTPQIQANNHDAAVAAGVDGLLTAIEGHPWTATAVPVKQPQQRTDWIVFGVIALIGLLLFIRYPRVGAWILLSILRGGAANIGGGAFRGGGGRSGGGGARGRW